MYAAGRHQELLALLDKAPFKWWHDRRWGVMALAAMGKKAEAIRYAEESRGLNDPGWQIAQACEEILLSSGLLDEAYRRYAIEANQGTTNLATFRAIAKKYPNKQPEEILRDLVSSTPGAEGKWFAAAKDGGLFAVAAELATRSPTDPRTLTRLDAIWDQLFPAEQTRIVKLLVEKVIVSPNDLEVRLRANGIERLVLELRPEPVDQPEEVLA